MKTITSACVKKLGFQLPSYYTKKIVNGAYGDQALRRTQIYQVMKKVKAGKTTGDQRQLDAKKTGRKSAFIAEIAAAVERDRWVLSVEKKSLKTVVK